MAFLGSARALGPILTLRQFRVTNVPRDGVFVEITGRPAGLMGWILTMVGLEPEQRFKATASDVTLDSSGLQGRRQEMAPISGIASVSAGFEKSLWTLLAGIVVLGYGLFRGFASDSKIALIAGLVVGGALLVKYWLSKRLHLAVETNGGRFIGLSFKRSVIENVTVDFEKCSAVLDILQQLILMSQSRRDVSPGESPMGARRAPGADTETAPAAPPGPAAAPGASTAARPARSVRCGKCGALLAPASRFCEDCGTRVEGS